MPKHSEKKIVNFTALQMFNLVADIDNYHLFLPWCNSSKIIEKTNSNDDTEHLIADLEIGYKNLIYTYRSNVLLNHKNLSIDVTFVHGPFKHLDNEWNFNELNNNKCEIDFSIDFELNIRVFNLLITRFFKQAFNKMVNSFEKRANKIYGSQ